MVIWARKIYSNCQAQVQSQIQVPNPSPKSKSQIQVPNPKSKVQRKGTVTGADDIILQATHHPPPPYVIFLTWNVNPVMGKDHHVMTFLDLPWHSMTFHDLLWPSMTYYHLLYYYYYYYYLGRGYFLSIPDTSEPRGPERCQAVLNILPSFLLFSD